jgi:hypothetical protein
MNKTFGGRDPFERYIIVIREEGLVSVLVKEMKETKDLNDELHIIWSFNLLAEGK